jgi:hypothetical protein
VAKPPRSSQKGDVAHLATHAVIPLSLAVLMLSACASSHLDGEACDPEARAPERVEAATPSPDGTGWCCRRDDPPSGDACASTGGWVADPCECGYAYAVSGSVATYCSPSGSCVWTPAVDEHGCERVEVSLADGCWR